MQNRFSLVATSFLIMTFPHFWVLNISKTSANVHSEFYDYESAGKGWDQVR